MATDKCDKCGKTKRVPPYMFGVYIGKHQPKTLCRECYREYTKLLDEVDKKFWGDTE